MDSQAGNGAVAADACARAHDLALEAHRRSEDLLAQLTKAQGRGLGAEDRRDALGCIASAIELLSSCRTSLGGGPPPTQQSDLGSRSFGRPPLPHPRQAQRQQQEQGIEQLKAEANGIEGSADGSHGGMGEFTKLLSVEEVEAELEPGTRLEDVLAGVIQQLTNPNQQNSNFGIPGLPPASGSQRSILSALPALSGQLKGLTPRRAALTERLLVGQLINAHGLAGGNGIPDAIGGGSKDGQPTVPNAMPAPGSDGENGPAVGGKRVAPDEVEEPDAKKAKKGGPEEPAGSYLPDDGWEWRKYGRKQMHGQPFPRSYFKCARAGKDDCKAKKQAERCSDDPTKWRVRYIGHHNHEKPPPRPVTITIVQDTIGGASAAATAASASADMTSPLHLPVTASGPTDGRDGAATSAGIEEKDNNPLSLGFSSRPQQPENPWESPIPFPDGSKLEASSSSIERAPSDSSDGQQLGKGLALAPPKTNFAGGNGNGDLGKGELIQDLDNLPPLPYNIQLFLPELPADEEQDERGQDRSPADTEFDETSTPPTPLACAEGREGFSFDIQQGVSALEQCFPPSLLEPLPPLPGASGGMLEIKESGGNRQGLTNGSSGLDSSEGGEEMSIMVPPRRPPALPAPVYANSPRIVVTPCRDFPSGSNMPGLTPSFTQDSARALFSSLLHSPLATGRLPSSTRVIFELGRVPQGNNVWPNFQNQGGYGRQ